MASEKDQQNESKVGSVVLEAWCVELTESSDGECYREFGGYVSCILGT